MLLGSLPEKQITILVSQPPFPHHHHLPQGFPEPQKVLDPEAVTLRVFAMKYLQRHTKWEAYQSGKVGADKGAQLNRGLLARKLKDPFKKTIGKIQICII